MSGNIWDTSDFNIPHRAVIPSVNCWRLPRRRFRRRSGKGRQWSWEPQQVYACWLRSRLRASCRRWGAFFPLPSDILAQTPVVPPGTGMRKPLNACKCHWTKRQQVGPIWRLSCCKRTAVVGLCGATIFSILSIIQAAVPALFVVKLSVTLQQTACFIELNLCHTCT